MYRAMTLAGLVLIAGCKKAVEIVQPAPPRLTAPVTVADQPSTIRMPIAVPLADLRREIEGAVPRVLQVIDEPPRVCIKTKSKLLPDLTCRLRGQVTRGPIGLTGAGDVITLTIPVSATVRAENIGKLIKHETATGAVVVTTRLRLGLHPDWTPTAKVDANYRWTNPIGVDFLGQRITFESKVDPKLHQILAQLERQLPAKLAKAGVRDKAAGIWAKGFRAERVKSEPLIWARFTPQAIGFSGYRVIGNQLVVGLSARMKTETIFGNKPADPPVTPLPRLEGPMAEQGINMHVPAFVPYGILEGAAGDALIKPGKRTLKLTNGHSVDVTVRHVTVYGSTGGKLAVGLDLLLDAVGGLVAPSGTVWFVATPVLDIPGRILSVRDLTLVGRTDSAVFNALVAAINDTSLHDQLTTSLRYDFARDYQSGLTKADAWLKEQPFEGFVFNGHLVGAAIRDARVAPAGVLISADAKAAGGLTWNPSRAAVLVAQRHAKRDAKERAKKLAGQ
ncbi:DUF4403 domain-containing protein [Sphingomonas antarctica]|uniref:DUF4403 family protein n=1 Tax=Sphingomonas antarctica TaxID=2040274 RepID=UPI0039EBB1EF